MRRAINQRARVRPCRICIRISSGQINREAGSIKQIDKKKGKAIGVMSSAPTGSCVAAVNDAYGARGVGDDGGGIKFIPLKVAHGTRILTISLEEFANTFEFGRPEHHLAELFLSCGIRHGLARLIQGGATRYQHQR